MVNFSFIKKFCGPLGFQRVTVYYVDCPSVFLEICQWSYENFFCKFRNIENLKAKNLFTLVFIVLGPLFVSKAKFHLPCAVMFIY